MELSRILDQLRRAFNGDAWGGPSLFDTLAGLTAAQAAAHPWPGTHSILEIVLHLTTWSRTVAARARAQVQTGVVGEDWPAVPAGPIEATWQQALADLQQAHEQLLADAAHVPAEVLDVPLGNTRDRPEGLGVSLYVQLQGVAQHYLYHAGQIALLRKYV